jgi:hypothetical protein
MSSSSLHLPPDHSRYDDDPRHPAQEQPHREIPGQLILGGGEVVGVEGE